MSVLFPEPDGFSRVSMAEANDLLARAHYLGPLVAGGAVLCVGGWAGGGLVATAIWRHPTARHLPNDGTWLELSRWCLTPAIGANGGSRMHAWTVRQLRQDLPQVTTLVSYSDPSQGHTGALYRACNWQWAPTWHRLRPPPTGQGSWRPGVQQAVKDRWVFPLRRDDRRADVLAVKDAAAERLLASTS